MKINSVKELRRALRELDGALCESLVIDGWGRIVKTGKRYGVAPTPDKDDTDLQRDYDACVYGWREKWVIDLVARETGIK